MSDRTRVLTPAEYVRSRFDLREWHHQLDGIGSGPDRRHPGFSDSSAFTHCICFGAAYHAVEPLLEDIARLRDALENALVFIETGPVNGGQLSARSIIYHALDNSTRIDHPSKRVPATEPDDG